jgi:hypothetical protein
MILILMLLFWVFRLLSMLGTYFSLTSYLTIY